MLTNQELQVVDWLRERPVATMGQMRQEFHLSHMTVFRALKKYGYYTSYNYNAAYYVLQHVPQFDEWGLWAYRDIRFSCYRRLPETILAVVEKAPAGLTIRELEERLQTKVANLVFRLVGAGRLRGERLLGHQAVYGAGDPERCSRQREQRQRLLSEQAVRGPDDLPPWCSTSEAIAVLQQMVLSSDDHPERLARRLQARGVQVTASQVSRVMDYYALKKKPHL
jgi:hypothetical protein